MFVCRCAGASVVLLVLLVVVVAVDAVDVVVVVVVFVMLFLSCPLCSTICVADTVVAVCVACRVSLLW